MILDIELTTVDSLSNKIPCYKLESVNEYVKILLPNLDHYKLLRCTDFD